MINAVRYTKELEESGFSKEQANTTIKVLMEIMDSKFATKQDIQLSEFALRSDMKEMETSIRADMKEMETSIRADMSILRADINLIRTEQSMRDQLIRSDMHSLENRLTIRLTRNMVVLFGLAIAIVKYL